MSAVIGIAGTLLFIAAVAAFIGKSFRDRFAEWCLRKQWSVWLIPFLTLCIYSLLSGLLGQWDADVFLKLFLYVLIPAAIIISPQPASLKHILIALLFWLPIEFGWVPTRWFEFILGGREIHYPLTEFVAVIFLFVIFSAWRKLDLHCIWKIGWKDLAFAGAVFLGLLAVILPVALTVGFVKFGLNEHIAGRPWLVAVLFASYFFTVGIPEELVARGIIQNLFEKKWGIFPAIVIASIIFGLAHLNNRVGTFEPPNWHYALFATIAGAGYGLVYWKRRSLVAAALTHTAIDIAWFSIFHG